MRGHANQKKDKNGATDRHNKGSAKDLGQGTRRQHYKGHKAEGRNKDAHHSANKILRRIVHNERSNESHKHGTTTTDKNEAKKGRKQ